jgi:hypothetical protein
MLETPSLMKLRCGRNPDPGRLRRVEKCLGRLTVRQWLAGDRPGDLGFVDLVGTYPHFGGERSWFACPSCRRRVGILYRPAAGDAWGCRTCHRLTYRSVQEAHQDERLRRAFERLERFRAARGDSWGDNGDFEALFDGLSTHATIAVCRAILIMDTECKRAAWEVLATYPGRLAELDA